MGLGTEAVPDHGYALFCTSVVMVILLGVFVCARIAVRLARKTMGTDDYITLVVLVSLFVCSTVTKPRQISVQVNLIALSATECLGKHILHDSMSPRNR